MSKSLVDYKGIKVNKELYPIIKHIEDVDKYREELGRLSSSWDIFALLGQLGDINIDIGKTKENFLNLTTTLLNHLSEETVKKVTTEMKFKAQVAIDIVIRNLFERTADIGFLATDDDIREFLQNFVSRYNSDSVELKEQIQKRFLEYVQKYSVYYDIVLADTKGKVVARLDNNIKVDWLDKEFTQKIITSNEEYVESFQYHDFIPHKKKSLVYSYKVTQTNDSDSEVLGVLCLCFRFRDEMEGIFNNLVEKRNKEALTILDEEGYVIASSDKDYIPLESKLELVLDEDFKIVSFCGRDYIAKTCLTNGYQGFNGLKWYGHIMIPLEYAFLSNQNNEFKIDEAIINSMMENEQHFSKELKEVFNKSKTIQENLGRVIWNGNVSQSKLNSSNREFSKSLLSEIGVTGIKANSSLSNLNQTIISSILKDSEFLSSLAIDIMDRNLYERANDCRWWALTSYFRKAFDEKESLLYKEEEISAILKYINDLYTVYTNILVFDTEGKIIAVSNENEKFLVGKYLSQEWVGQTLKLEDTSKYCVSKFEKTNLYSNEATYVYCAAIRSFENADKINGGIAVVFDSTPQFEAMLQDSLPKGNESVFALFTTRDKKVISSTNKEIEINSIIELDDKFFQLKNAEQKSEVVEINNKYYALGVRCSQGYREYKSATDDYVNDVFCLVFNYIGEKAFDERKYENKSKFLNSGSKKIFTDSCVELATFHLGNKFLAVEAKNVIESISIDKLEVSIDMDKTNPFKGMVLYKDNLISVLDIRSFIKEDIKDEELNTIILFEYDKDNKEHCIGILVSSLQSVSVVEKDSIQQIQSHFLGAGTLIESLADISDYEESQVAMILDIKKIDDNLTKKL
ncbi:cache domain-containing protein [Halarcobacter bivalviorum]|uniref:CheW-like domain-containing protein n=1 Tax=Halarcobacter bivalviorum TaxID=663364 RepID=A0AAX2ADL4_9BACT|nr:cache domain-containing protein [Halarcobacter bivalviorum]AXH11708.1 CheW-like domain-containing protein [Halarcobacter bivalviorum]RXK10841.1 chemotaxis protein CheW [Halarcobacter bivalviorum]